MRLITGLKNIILWFNLRDMQTIVCHEGAEEDEVLHAAMLHRR